MNKWQRQVLKFVVRLKNWWNSNKDNNKGLGTLIIIPTLALIFLIAFVIWSKEKSTSVWEIVPNDAILVLETDQATRIHQKLDSAPFWQPLRSLPYLQTYHSRKTTLDGVMRDSIDLMNYLDGRKIYISLHQTSRSSADLLFFVPMSVKDKLVSNIIEKLHKNVPFKKSERAYHDIIIHEIKLPQKENTVVFTYAKYKNFLIGSYTPFLVEDAVRKIAKEEGQPFFKENKDLLELTKIDDDDANLYINASRLPKLFALFADEEHTSLLTDFEKWAKSAVLDVMMKEHLLLLNGHLLTQSEGRERDFLSILEQQTPTFSTELQKFIPQETALFYRIGLSDKENYFDKLQDYRKEYYPNEYAKQEKLIDEYSFSPSKFRQSIGSEIAVAVLEMPENREFPEKLLFLSIDSKENILSALNLLAENALVTGEEVKGITEIYEGLPITRIEVEEFPLKMFGEGFSGFSQSYFTLLEDKYIVIGSSFQAVQTLIDDYQNERVWGKLVRQRQFFEKIGDKATLSVVIDLPRSWNWMLSSTSDEWKQILEKYKYQLLKIEFIAWQAQAEKNHFTTSAFFQQQKSLLASNNKEEKNGTKTVFRKRLESRPFLVKNHIDRSKEILVQDEDDMLYLISKGGKILWNYYLNGTMRPQVYQLDIYKNGKLQYLIATPNKIYLIDRLGRAVTGFPISFPEKTFITHLSLIDYDNSKNYRIGVVDSEGNAFLFDKTGKKLPGWQPRRLGMSVSAPLMHIRAGKRDAMVAIQQDGIVNVMKRNSKMFDDFPLNFDTDISNDFYVDYGNSLSSTSISMLSETGELIKLNLEGKILDRKYFEKGEQGALFTLAIDQERQQSFVISRQDSRKLSVYSSEEKLLFSKTFDNDGTKLMQYFNFGASLEIIAVTDMHAQKTYLFYTNGLLIKTINSSSMIAMHYSEQNSSFTLYHTLKNECREVVFGK